MPDENKFDALREAGFQVKRTCRRCEHFNSGALGWGTCIKITYSHLKHTAKKKLRQASVPSDGWCRQHSICSEAQAVLGAHQEFVEPKGRRTFLSTEPRGPCKCGKRVLFVCEEESYCGYECLDKALNKRGS